MLGAQNVGSSKMLVWLVDLHFRNGIRMKFVLFSFLGPIL